MKNRSFLLGLTFALALALVPIHFNFSSLSLEDQAAYAQRGGSRGGSRGGGWGGSRNTPRVAPSRPAPTRPNRVVPPAPLTPPGNPRPVAKPVAPRPSAAAQAQAREASAAKMRAAAATSKVRPLPKQALTQRYGTRTPAQIRGDRTRIQNRYSPEQRTTIVNNYSYRDTFDPFFMFQISMMANMAMAHSFHYHHWNDYSAERQAKLLAENAALKVEMEKMKLAGVAVDPTFVPKEAGIDPALMKTQEAVNREFGLPAEDDESNTGRNILIGLGVLGALGLGYGVFFHRTSTYA